MAAGTAKISSHVSHGSYPPRLLHPPPAHDNDKDRAAAQSSAMDRRCGVCTNDRDEYDSEDNYSQSSFEDDDCWLVGLWLVGVDVTAIYDFK